MKLEIGGLSIALTVLFVVLKLTNVIDWDWWWVICPLWIPLLIVGAIFAFILLALLMASIASWKER